MTTNGYIAALLHLKCFGLYKAVNKEASAYKQKKHADISMLFSIY